MDSIIEKIIKLRKQKGFSQKDLADKLGIATINYGKYERGESVLTVVRLKEIAKILDVDLKDLFIEPNDEPNQFLKYNELDKGSLQEVIHDKELAAIELLYKLCIRLINKGLPEKDPGRIFHHYLHIYLNDKIENNIGYKWFKDFISFYNIDTYKNKYPEFFDQAKKENNNQVLSKIRITYSLKNDNILNNLMKEWYRFFLTELYFEAFRIKDVFSVLQASEKAFKTLVPEDIFEIWMKYKKIVEKET